MTPDEIREQLREAGARLATAKELHTKAINDIGEAMRAGHADKSVEVTEMIRLAGVTRTTAYRLIGKG